MHPGAGSAGVGALHPYFAPAPKDTAHPLAPESPRIPFSKATRGPTCPLPLPPFHPIALGPRTYPWRGTRATSKPLCPLYSGGCYSPLSGAATLLVIHHFPHILSRRSSHYPTSAWPRPAPCNCPRRHGHVPRSASNLGSRPPRSFLQIFAFPRFCRGYSDTKGQARQRG